MLLITVRGDEEWDEANEEFLPSFEITLRLEHSLVSISKWEAKWHKAFLGKQPKTSEESLDYIRCMVVSQNVEPRFLEYLTPENINEINSYIDNPMSATYIPDRPNGAVGKDVATSELIYYWMVAYQIPSEYEKWHLNRLLTLIKICDLKNSPNDKPRNVNEIMQSHAAINAARRKKLGTKG